MVNSKDCHLLIGYVLLVLASFSLSQAAYLPDYEYIQGVGWLRLHIVPATWADAQLRCHLEDATLTAPTTSTITAVMKTKMLAHRLAESSVFTDIYASNPKGDYTSVNGLPMSNITLQWAVGEPNNLGDDEDCLVMTGAGELADASCSSVHPFFCLKRNSQRDQSDKTYTANKCNNIQEVNQFNTAHNENECNCTIVEANQCSTTQEAKQCDTTAQGYTLEPRTGSCYNFYRTGIPWYRAAMKCASEHAHLAVINSDVESQVLKELFAQNPPETIMKSHDNDYAHIGFVDWTKTGEEWLTVFGETFEEAGFNEWNVNEPNNYGGDEYCGSVERSGKLNDHPCVAKNLPYICEITPK